MIRCSLCGLVALSLFACQTVLAAEDPIFSGPQVGETIPPLKAKGVFGDRADREIDLIEKGDTDPLALIFVHARTRPAFGLTNTIMKWAASREGLRRSVVFLTDDATSTSGWMRKIKSYFPDDVTYAVSADGAEGPGSFGLNRNVTLTVLIGNEGKVTANFALVQPSIQADGPKILQAIVDVTGGGKAPTIAEISGGRYARNAGGDMRRMQQTAPKLGALVRAAINKQASDEEVAKAVAAVDAHVAEDRNARVQLGQIAARIVNSENLPRYGTEAARKAIRQWAKKYGPQEEASKDESKQ